MLKEGLKCTKEYTVEEKMLAVSVGSGDLPVLATPTLLAQAEHAAMLTVAPQLEPSDSTVGGYLAFKHLRPTALGGHYTVHAELKEVRGKKLSFELSAFDAKGKIGEGSHVRFIVDRKQFLSKMS